MKPLLGRLLATSLLAATFAACQYEPNIALDTRIACYPTNPRYFYLWLGPTNDAPAACPAWATVKLLEAHDGVIPGSLDCPACSCAPSGTSCSYPTDWTVVASSCAESPGSGEVFFGAPDNWNGACSSQTSLPAGLECEGAEPCAQSMAVAAPEVIAAPCLPENSGEPTRSDPAWTWEITALACAEAEPEYSSECEAGVQMYFKPPDGFRTCTQTEADVCPGLVVQTGIPGESTLIELYVNAEDTRTCSPCGCEPPEGNACSMEVSAYTDPGCVNEAGSAVVSSTGGAACFDLPDGTALAGKRAELVDVTPGTCAPTGGEVIGQVQPVKPVRFCCEKYE